MPLFRCDVPEVETRLLRDLQLPDRDALLSYLDMAFPSTVAPSTPSRRIPARARGAICERSTR